MFPVFPVFPVPKKEGFSLRDPREAEGDRKALIWKYETAETPTFLIG
jgi:hypothetical protein